MIEKFTALVNGFKFLTLGILIGLDWLAGVIVALKEGNFKFQYLANYLRTDVLHMIGGYLIVGITATFEPSLEPAVIATFVAIDISLVSSILEKIKKLGIPVPERLMR